ncbi:MAG: NfeD family protein [Desulfosoma sp.]|uniref:NfeD family protein n=1 Tax=Desulfosoma sp. TaxID=2603217 RepID=UPI004049E291
MPYWVWMALGMVLIMLEIFIPNFVVIWFGAGGFFVGVLVAVLALTLTQQLFIWAVSSLALVAIWFLWIKPRMGDKTTAGLSREAVLGAVGQVIEAPKGERRGKLRFSVPVLGTDEWPCLAQEGEAVEVGDRVQVMAILGNALVVRSVKGGET